MPGPAPEDRVPGDAGGSQAAALQTGGRKQGVLPTSPCSWRVQRAEVGGEAGAPVPAVLLCRAGLSQGLAHSNPNHL